MPAIKPERLAAIAVGDKIYIPAEPCRYGHLGPKITKTAQCIPCLQHRRKKWLKARPGLEAAWARKRRAKDPTGHRAEVKRWREKNKEKVRTALKRWKQENISHVRAKGRAYRAEYRTRITQNGGKFTFEDIENIFAKQKGKCACCEIELETPEIDHIIPVARGGTSDPSNIQLLCLPCNRSKGARTVCQLHHTTRASVVSS